MVIKLIRYFFFFLSGLIFFLIIYRINFHGKLLEFSSHLYYQKYYLIALSLCVFGYISNYLKKKLVVSITLIFFSIIISFYTIEAILSIQEILKRGEDKRSIKSVYLEKKKIDPTATIYLSPTSFLDKNYSLLPVSHKSNSLIIDCNELGYYSINKSDRFGFNNSNSIWNKKIDYLLIGDSYIYGQCVYRKDNIASIASVIMQKNILNLAMPGNGFFLSYASFKEFYDLKKPKKIIWFINDRDFMDVNKEFENLIIKNYLENPNFKQNLINKTDQIDLIMDDLFYKRISRFFFQDFLLLKKSKEFIRFHLNLSKYTEKHYDKIKIDENIKKNIFNLFNNVKKQLDSETELIIAHYPLKDKFLNSNYSNNLKDLTKSIAIKFDFKFIDLEMAFENTSDPIMMYSKDYNHNNEIGYKLISEYLSKKLEN